MAAKTNGTLSPQNGYKGVGTLLKHWGNSETNEVNEKQMKICEDSGLDSLLHLARMSHVKVQSLATNVINSLREGENGDIYIDSEEGFRPLVDLAKFAEEDVQREAVWSLAILASNNSCQARIEQEVGWHNFRKYAASPVPEIQAGTAILLGNLALEKKNQENIMVKGVPLLMSMLSETRDPKVRRAVVTALSNVSIIEGYGARDVWLDKGIELMMPFIEQGDDSQLQIGALNTIANVCNHDKAVELKKKVAILGGIGRLVPLLDSQDEMIVKLAAMTVANLASDDHHRSLMHGLHIEEPLIRLLDSRDEEIQLGVAMAVNALSDHEPTRKEFRVRQASEPLKELIHVTKDRDIAKEAKEALKKIAPDEYTALNLESSSSYSSYSSSANEEEDSYTHSSSYVSHSGSEEDEDEDDSRSSGESYTDSVDEEDGKEGTRKQEEKKTEEARRFRAEQQRRKEKDEDEEKENRKSISSSRSSSSGHISVPKKNQDEEVNEDAERSQRKSLSVAGDAENQRRSILLNKEESGKSLNEEEIRAKRAEAVRRKELDEAEDSEGDKVGVEIAAESSKRAEEKRSRRLEGDRQLEGESDGEQDSSSDQENNKDIEHEEEITEEERKKRQEAERVKKDEDEKRAEVERRKREESERKRKIEEEEFMRREEVERANREEQANGGDNRSPGSPSGRNGRSGDRGSMSSSDGIVIPKNPAKALVVLLKEVRKNKSFEKAIDRDALRELERFANRKERDQIHYGEDIIAILVYIIYFYPDADYPDIIVLSLYILALLARYQIRNQWAIRRARGGDQLIRLLQSTVEHVRRNAALALGAYSLNNKAVQSEVNRSIDVLGGLLESQETPPATLRTVAACLASIADNNPQNQQQIIAAGTLRVTINKLPAHKHFTRTGLHLVAAIVSNNVSAQNQVILDHPRFLNDLLNMLNAPDALQYRESVISTLVELSKKNSRVQLSVYHASGLNSFVNLLKDYKGDEDKAGVVVYVNSLYLLLTQIKLTKYSKRVREDLAQLKVVDVVRPMCSAANRQLAESALSLTKAIEDR